MDYLYRRNIEQFYNYCMTIEIRFSPNGAPGKL